MKKVLKTILFVVFLSATFTSCGDVSRKVDENIEKLIKKTESLDSLLNQEVDKILIIDSLIDKERLKVIKLDSLIQKSSSKLDSVVNRVINPENK